MDRTASSNDRATGKWPGGAGSMPRRTFLRSIGGATLGGLTLQAVARPARGAEAGRLRAGAAAIDVSPTHFPAIVSGGFLERTATGLADPLFARCLALDDGQTRVAIVVVDSLMIPREMADSIKRRAESATGIAADHILISAVHTHSAPSVMGALGTGVDEPYAEMLPGLVAKAIEQAVANLQPAKAGWAAVSAPDHTHCRRWILRPDHVGEDPFGARTVRAMMHPGYQNPAYVGPAGPVDTALTVLAVQTSGGEPLAVLANYSMHYFGSGAVSADYFGRFCRNVEKRLAAAPASRPLVAMMSQGTSGDLHWMDYSQPQKPRNIDGYADELAAIACEAIGGIEYLDQVPLAMAETTLSLRRRTPDQARLAWARKIIQQMPDGKPRNRTEVYALEQVYLAEEPVRDIRLQAIRVGALGITAIPCEVFGITGLKLKACSPFETTMNFELANGGDGYIPPPEQHALGGYTTWPARTAGLETQAEPKIVEAVLKLLEAVSGKPRRALPAAGGPYLAAVLESKPIACWPLDEIAGTQAADRSGHENQGVYEPGIALYLEGPDRRAFASAGHASRAAHFAGGRMKATVKGLSGSYSVSLWFWNGLPTDARPITGHLFSRGADGSAEGDHLAISGAEPSSDTQGRLRFHNGDPRQKAIVGKTRIALRTWNHVTMVRDGRRVAVYLNGQAAPEIDAEVEPGCAPGDESLFVGGRSDGQDGFEGKIAAVAIFDRGLRSAEIAAHHAAAERTP